KGRRADRAAGVAGRGRAIHFLEWRAPINFSVRDRVHRTPAGDGEILGRMFFVQLLQEREERFLVSRLDRTRDVFVFLFDWMVGLSRGARKTNPRGGQK